MTHPTTPPELPPSTPPKPPTAVVVIVAVLLVACCGFGIHIATSGDHKPDPIVEQIVALDACRAAVKDQLKAPASAKFPGDEKVTAVGGGFDFVGAVDAQNSFGAMLRDVWTCDARKVNGLWQTSNVAVAAS